MSLKKTVTLSQFPRTHTFTINQNQLEDVDKFTYTGSTLTKSTTVDQEILIRLGKRLLLCLGA